MLMLSIKYYCKNWRTINYKTNDMSDYSPMHPVLSYLSYLLKAPVVPEGTPVCNALFKQQRFITNLLCACAGLAHDADFSIEHVTKLPAPSMNIKASM